MNATERAALLERAYQLFNERDVDALFRMMKDDVEWPDVAQGAVLRGKEAIRPYWEAQFAVSDPTVRPTAFMEAGDDLVAVVEQRVYDLQGGPLAPPMVVFHRYTFDGDLVRRMVVFTDRAEAVSTD
jgi:ketosteroid isomerase-like protein